MRLILVHGFTQTAKSWAPVMMRLPEEVEPTALDIPVGLEFAATASALGDAGGEGIYVGYSMGGRLCLRLALDRPDLVRGLVLVSTSAGIDDPAERLTRYEADCQLAKEIERDGVDAFLLRWLAQPLFASLTIEDSDLEDRHRHTAEELASMLRTLSSGLQEPLWNRLGELSMPVLIVAGSLDTKFTGLARRFYDAIPDAEVAVVQGAGHAAHLEHPDAIAELLGSWAHGATS
ncbi:MAG: alpha/beta fold hydrolase [Acidimicrobiia bacterium]